MAELDSISSVLRVCANCKKEKQLSEFHKTKNGVLGRRKVCKSCVNAAEKEKKRLLREQDPDGFAKKQREYNVEWHRKNAERASIVKARYKAENAESVLSANKSWYAKNKEEVLAKSKIYREKNRNRAIEYHLEWRKSNRDHVVEYRKKYLKDRIEADPVFAMSKRVRHFICLAILKMGYTKRSRSTEILGCGWQEFKMHIEAQFVKGMNWSNRSDWHIDHIVPLSSATNEQELIALNHYTNLRPLWAVDNLKKGAKLDYLI